MQFHDKNLRTKYGYLEAWVSIIGNILIFVIKIIFGFLVNSISLIADSFHTLSDILTSIIVLIGFKIARKPADKEHPFGHGRMEDIATLIIALLLIIVAFEIIENSFRRIIHPEVVTGATVVIIMLIISGLAKEWMARFSFKLGNKIESDVLVADAWHHRSDAITNILVVIAIIASRFGYYKVDSVLGIVISLVIIFISIRLIRSSASYLLGKAPDEKILHQINEITRSVPDVKGVHDILVHAYGANKMVSLHIEVDKNMDVKKAHEIATAVENKIWRATESPAVVHIDLAKKKSKSKSDRTGEVLNKIIHSLPEIKSYHGVNFMSSETQDSLDFHIVVKADMTVEESHNLSHKLSELIKKDFKDYIVNIHIEPLE